MFIEDALQLVSGASDTDLIVWDIVNEAGIVRLHGHSGPITDCAYLESQQLLLTTSKDHFVKVWDAEGQHCVQTIVGHRSEVQSIVLSADGSRMITGSDDNELRFWAVLQRDEATPEQLEASQGAEGVPVVFMPLGSLNRQSRERVVSLKLSSDGTLLACQGADKTLELFRFRTEEQIAKKMKRRAKRVREKGALKVEGEGEADEPEVAESAMVRSPNDLATPPPLLIFRADRSPLRPGPVFSVAEASALTGACLLLLLCGGGAVAIARGRGVRNRDHPNQRQD